MNIKVQNGERGCAASFQLPVSSRNQARRTMNYMTIGFAQQSMVDLGTCFDWRSGPGDRACLQKDVLGATFRMFPGDVPSQLVDS